MLRTLTLCGSYFGANPSLKKASSFPCSSRSSFPSRNPHRHFRRCTCGANMEERFLGHFRQEEMVNGNNLELRVLHFGSNETSLDSMDKCTDHDLLDRADEDISLLGGISLSNCLKDGRVLSSISWKGLGFALLFGLSTFHGCPLALANEEFSGAMQSVNYIGDLGDISTGFASAFLLIFFSELGDKTFFIAALLAARNSGAVVFIGTFGALAAMTVVSVILGRTFHYVDGILPFRIGETDLPIDDIAAVCLLTYFGVSTLLEAASGDELKMTEEQKEAEIAISELSGNGAGILAAANTVISTFLLVFVAEWGDKSFFSTIALAAASSPIGVIGGALAGHAVATLIAVVGGSLLGSVVSEKAVAYVGGVLFLIFAAVTLIEIVF